MTTADRETSEVIRREIREGTPNTPERIATIKRADETYRRYQQGRFAKIIQDFAKAGRLAKPTAWEMYEAVGILSVEIAAALAGADRTSPAATAAGGSDSSADRCWVCGQAKPAEPLSVPDATGTP